MAMTPLERLDAAVASVGAYTADRAPRGVAHDDADDVFGTIESDDAAAFDPLHVLRALDRRDARAVVIGQVAGILHGSQELTGDLDLLWSGKADEAAQFAAAFADVGAQLQDDEHRPIPLDAHAFTLPKVLFRSPCASGDCCTPNLPWAGLDVVGIIERASMIRESGVTVHYVSLPDLIEMRRASGRPKDARRVAELEALV